MVRLGGYSATTRLNMWSEEKMREAADKWMESLNPYFGNDWDKAETAYQSFLAGCDYIINNTQKNESNRT